MNTRSHHPEAPGRDENSFEARTERIMVGFIVFAATVCVGVVTAYLLMFDARGLL